MKEKIAVILIGILALAVIILSVDSYNQDKKLDALQGKYSMQEEQLQSLVGENTREDLDHTLEGLIKMTNFLEEEFTTYDEALMLLAEYVDANTSRIEKLREVHDNNVDIFNDNFDILFRR